jgi:hypothetical protein
MEKYIEKPVATIDTISAAVANPVAMRELRFALLNSSCSIIRNVDSTVSENLSPSSIAFKGFPSFSLSIVS